jgi:cell division septum initiation protein DivIVA
VTDPISLAVSTAQQAIAWAKQIADNSRNKREATAARTIAYAGVIVADIRGLHAASEHLLRPLTTFRTAEWTPEDRQAWIEEARNYDGSRDIMTDMNQRMGALVRLPLGTDDEARALRSRLIDLAADVAHTGQSEAKPEKELDEHTEPLEWRKAAQRYNELGLREFGASWSWGGPDMLIKNFLPALMWLVAHADEENDDQVKTLRAMANGLRATRTLATGEPMERVVRDADEIFGALSGHLLGKYPKLPEPEWRPAG